MSGTFDDMLAHFGVRGMRWGVRKKSGSTKSGDGEKKDAKKGDDSDAPKKPAPKKERRPLTRRATSMISRMLN
jgi:hypothetical protein